MSELSWTGERFIPGEGGPEIAYEHLARYRLALRCSAGRRVLDVGSGEGYGAALLATNAESVLGVDVDATAVGHATRRHAAPNLAFRTIDAASLGRELSPGFDLVTCFEMIEHVGAEVQRALIPDLAALLSPSGILLLSTPNRAVYRETSGPNFENPFHLHELDLGELTDLLRGSFPETVWWEQRAVSGSTIRRLDREPEPDEATGAWVLEPAELTKGGVRTPPSTRSPGERAKYLVVACAHHHAALAALERVEGLVLADVDGKQAHEDGVKARWAVSVAADVQRLEAELAAGRSEVESEREGAARLAEELASARRQLELVRVDLERSEEDRAGLRQALGASVEARRIAEEAAAGAAAELARVESRATAAERSRDDLRQALADIHRSRLWRLGHFYWTLRDPSRWRRP